ncbi:MAG TPA: ATP-binding cassette domain-containing protein [Acidimicrobiales bacterium]|nr:ATP-binding cassette domain-containing protein [Acidimicrobiales bacterium]
MAADDSPPERPRSWVMAAAVARFWGIARGLTAVWLLTTVTGPMVPLAVTAASGRVVGAVPDVVTNGFDSPAGRRLVVGLGVMAVLAMLGVFVDSLRWRSADLLGHRFRADQGRRIMAAFLGRAGIDHADDPAVQDAAAAADNNWLRSLPEGLMNVAGNRVNGYGGALLVALYEPIGALALTLAWMAGGRWKWRRAVEDAKANLGQVRALRRSTATAELATSPHAAKEIRLFGLGDWLGARFAREWHTAMAEVWRLRGGGVGVGVGVFALLLGAHALAVTRIATAAAAGDLGLGSVAVALQAVIATRGIGGVPWGFHEVQYGLTALPAMARLEAVLAEAPDLEGTGPAPRLAGAIRVESVRYRYPRSDRDVLAGVDFEIPAGTSVAIVGDNGAGKSTLVQLLARLRDPTEGRITVDGTDLVTVVPTAWQESVAAVSQRALRLPLSARRNLAGGRHVADERLDEAVADAKAAGIVDAFAGGWDTPLSREFTGGADLSGGEWQRLALARALVALEAGAQVLVLDEPTAHLDVRAEADLYDHFLRLTRGRTTILVSHRFSTVRRADRIVVLDRGRVVEQGSHDELLAAGGRYAAMFTLQASRFAEIGDA